MATWLHDVDVLTHLAESDAGLARDWATTRLALAAPERFSVFPDDARVHDVVLAANPPKLVDALIAALNTRRPCSSDLADAVAALGLYGALPADPGPLAAAMKGALQNNGAISDLWLAYAMAQLDLADGAALQAAAKTASDETPWALPVVLLRVASKMGATDEAAEQVAAEMVALGEPQRLFGVLSGLGIPVGALGAQFRDLDHAVAYGAHVAHAHAAVIQTPQGSIKRRVAKAVDQLVDGLPGPGPALLRAIVQKEVRAEWALWVAAIASYLRGKSQPGGHGGADIVHDVLYHGEGNDPVAMSTARRSVQPNHRGDLAAMLSDLSGWNVPAAVLAMQLVPSDAELARLVVGIHPGTLDADHRIVALACAAAFHDPDSIPTMLASEAPARRMLGYILAEWVPSAEVLASLLQGPVPADPLARLQYARALAATGEAAIVPVMQAMLKVDDSGALDEPKRLAEQILGTPISA